MITKSVAIDTKANQGLIDLLTAYDILSKFEYFEVIKIEWIKTHKINIRQIAIIPVIHSLLHAYIVWPLERYRSPINFIVALVGIWAVLYLYDKMKIKFSSKELFK